MSARWTPLPIAARVAASFGANTARWIGQPNSGRMIRSPGSVARMDQIASAMSRSPREYERPPRPLTRIGNCQPAPRKESGTSIPHEDARDAAEDRAVGDAVLQGRIAHADDALAVDEHGRARLREL